MNNTTSVRVNLLLLLAPVFYLVSSPALAADTIKVNRSATYFDNSVGNSNMRSECEFDTQIVESLARYSKGRIEITDQKLSNIQGKTLRIVITDVHAAGGGGWSGPKWAYLHATLKEGDRVINEFDVGSKSGGGGHMTACGVLSKIANALGAKTARRVLSPGRNAPRDKDDDAAASAHESADTEKESSAK